MYKFCTHCGAKMPNENAFCTNCGAKFSQIPTPQQNIAPTNINYNTSNSNTMPSYMHNQQTQQINIYSAIKYQAMDILKQSAPLQNNPSPSVNNFFSSSTIFPSKS